MFASLRQASDAKNPRHKRGEGSPGVSRRAAMLRRPKINSVCLDWFRPGSSDRKIREELIRVLSTGYSAKTCTRSNQGREKP